MRACNACLFFFFFYSVVLGTPAVHWINFLPLVSPSTLSRQTTLQATTIIGPAQQREALNLANTHGTSFSVVCFFSCVPVGAQPQECGGSW